MIRFILILLNVCLAGALLYSAGEWIRESSSSSAPSSLTAVKRNKKSTEPVVSRKITSAQPAMPVAGADEMKAFLKDHNVFDPARCPNARVPGRTRTNNERISMTLVGTFQIGDLSGAIILQKKQKQDQVNQQMQNMQNPIFQQMVRQFQQAQSRNQNARGSNNNNNNRNNRSAARQRNLPAQTANADVEADDGVSYQQYVRVGETLANGYKLASVSRSGAVLTRNSEKLELEIQTATTAASSKSSSGNSSQPNMMPGMPPNMPNGMFPRMMPNMPNGMFPGGDRGGSNNNNGNTSRSRRNQGGNSSRRN